MRKLFYIIILVLCFLCPVKRLDIAKLEPVEAVTITVRDGFVHLLTDTESEGEGVTVAEAVQSLKEKTPGIIYLDTARFLLIGEKAQGAAEELKKYLRANVRSAPYCGADIIEEVKRLDAHSLAEKPWG